MLNAAPSGLTCSHARVFFLSSCRRFGPFSVRGLSVSDLDAARGILPWDSACAAHAVPHTERHVMCALRNRDVVKIEAF